MAYLDINGQALPMNRARCRQLARDSLSGYVSGPDAPTQATSHALAKVEDAAVIVLVEGISDQIALETLAARRSRDLGNDGVVILPVGGAQAVAHYLQRFGPNGADLRLVGLCDAGGENVYRTGLSNAGIGAPQTRADMERLGFYICVDDLEDELIGAVGPGEVESLFDSQGDLGSFRTLQNQPDWRTKSVEAQMHRFLGSGARRKLRYAQLLVAALDLDHVPDPLARLLAHV